MGVSKRSISRACRIAELELGETFILSLDMKSFLFEVLEVFQPGFLSYERRETNTCHFDTPEMFLDYTIFPSLRSLDFY